MRTRALPLVIALSLATAPIAYHLPYAFAQAMDADTKEAKALFEDGVKFYKAGKYEEARVKFKAAYGLKKRPSIVLNLAHAERQSKHPIEAIAHYKELLGMPDAKPDDKDDAKAGMLEARKQLGLIIIDAPTGTSVTIDGEARQVPSDNTIEVLPGTHTIALKVGGKDVVQKVDLVGGQKFEINAKGESAPPPAATTAAPPATTAPPVTTAPPATTTETAPPVVTAEPTATAAPTTTAPPVEGPKQNFFKTIHPVTYISAGATLLFAAGWIGFYASSQTHYDNADEYAAALKRPTCGTPDSVGKACTSENNKANYRVLGRNEIDKGDSQKTLAIVSGVLTGVALGATIATFILLRKKEQPAVSFVGAPLIGGGATFALVGRF